MAKKLPNIAGQTPSDTWTDLPDLNGETPSGEWTGLPDINNTDAVFWIYPMYSNFTDAYNITGGLE